MHISTTIEIDETDYAIEFDVENIEVGNDGIGPYEFWGQRGVDRGHDFVEEFDIVNLKAEINENLKYVEKEVDFSTMEGKALRDKLEDAIYDSNEIRAEIDRIYFEPPEPDGV
jgi:hypothetical protein